ncbi:DUF4126 domain-containing protein [Agrococcus sp. SGAir0287]|uniref:DUF4126 domain-containing protein n=1 Tax=Agrococcus sp. SGAir0287 TaxID=2070347 RepID=UPI0010CCF70E|nr:DUF4126 domain-containing protein [Agrococcus sp. SGAir0287]QCR19283.1 DUF4126 domain-containing protein [Agrococcus sp. SGAir0287]
MLELLTGSGLAAAAGMNAYVPLLAVGVANRFLPEILALPEGWQWLSNEWVLGIVAVLLVVEVVADKIPAVDTVNDVLQTVVRPASGGLVFGSSSTASTVAVTDPAAFFESNQWVPVVIGVVIALAVHGTKMAVRPVANVVTGGTAAPVISTFEDVGAVGMTVLAIVLPVLVIVALVALVAIAVAVVRRGRRGTGAPAHEPGAPSTA